MVEIAPLTPHLGAQVNGVDLSKPVDSGTFAELRQAFTDWSVLVFRDQHLTRDQHKSFARRFGELHVHPSKELGARGDPEIFKIKADETTDLANGAVWHTDVSCEAVPPLGSMLYLTESPLGGDTCFADMYLAYELLSEPLRTFLDELTAVHDGRQDLARYGVELKPGQTYPRAEHPIVVHHPDSGRQLLFVNEGFTSHIPALTRQESGALLDLLFRHIATTVQLQCRVGSQANTVRLWDNRSVQHHAVWDYYPASRYGERVSIRAETAPCA